MKYSTVNYIDIEIPMRDGVKLIADLCLPSAEGTFPVILCRSPYNATGTRNSGALTWCERGFAYIGVDCRGRFKSEGVCHPNQTELEDGYDTLEWIAAQKWCNGNVGMVGGSYVAVTQLYAAASGHPALKAIAPSAMGANMYDAYYTNGVPEFSFMPSWHIGCMCSRGVNASPDWAALRKMLPLVKHDDFAKIPSPSWKKIITTPDPADKYWQNVSLGAHAEKINTAFLIQESYYDLLGESGPEVYLDLIEKAGPLFKKHSYMRLGPWGHGVNTPEGDFAQFGADAIVTEDAEVDFLTKALASESPLTDSEPGRICYFTMIENKWHHTNTWPPAGVVQTPFYLGSRGSANTLKGDGFVSRLKPAADMPFDTFVFDPADPVPSCGGRMVGRGGICDQSEVERRADVLVYTLPPLTEDLNVTGNITAELFVSSDAPDTDFTVKVVDVAPTLRPTNVCDGIVRMRYRDGYSCEKFMKKDEVCRVAFKVDFTSYLFKAGHRVRFEISSSNFPHFAPNCNTGANVATDEQQRKAVQKVYHSEKYPSCVYLPVKG